MKRVPALVRGKRRPQRAACAGALASGSYREIVGVRQHDGWLYLGSLYETAVGRVPVPA